MADKYSLKIIDALVGELRINDPTIIFKALGVKPREKLLTKIGKLPQNASLTKYRDIYLDNNASAKIRKQAYKKFKVLLLAKISRARTFKQCCEINRIIPAKSLTLRTDIAEKAFNLAVTPQDHRFLLDFFTLNTEQKKQATAKLERQLQELLDGTPTFNDCLECFDISPIESLRQRALYRAYFLSTTVTQFLSILNRVSEDNPLRRQSVRRAFGLVNSFHEAINILHYADGHTWKRLFDKSLQLAHTRQDLKDLFGYVRNTKRTKQRGIVIRTFADLLTREEGKR